jgi:hypothetical protein
MSDEVMVELYAEGKPVDPEEIDRVTLALRRELLDIDEVAAVGSVAAGPAPPGARGLELAAIGALAVSVQPTADVLVKVFAILKGFLVRRESAPRSTLRVTVNGQMIELSPTKEQQAQLVARFIDATAVS